MTHPPSGPRPADPRIPADAAPRLADPGPPVEQALAALDGLADRPLAEHVGVFERLHATLQDALGAGEAAGRA